MKHKASHCKGLFLQQPLLSGPKCTAIHHLSFVELFICEKLINKNDNQVKTMEQRCLTATIKYSFSPDDKLENIIINKAWGFLEHSVFACI